MLHVLPSWTFAGKARLGQNVGEALGHAESLKGDVEIHMEGLRTLKRPDVQNVSEGCLVVAVSGVLVDE